MGDNMLGLIVAGLSVVSSGMQQIFCRTMQQKHGLSSHELLSNTAPAQVSLHMQATVTGTPLGVLVKTCAGPCLVSTTLVKT